MGRKFEGLREPTSQTALIMPFHERKARDTLEELQRPSNATKKEILLQIWKAGGRIYYSPLEEALKKSDATLTSELIKAQIKELIEERLLWGAVGKGGMVFLTEGSGKDLMILFDKKRE